MHANGAPTLDQVFSELTAYVDSARAAPIGIDAHPETMEWFLRSLGDDLWERILSLRYLAPTFARSLSVPKGYLLVRYRDHEHLIQIERHA